MINNISSGHKNLKMGKTSQAVFTYMSRNISPSPKVGSIISFCMAWVFPRLVRYDGNAPPPKKKKTHTWAQGFSEKIHFLQHDTKKKTLNLKIERLISFSLLSLGFPGNSFNKSTWQEHCRDAKLIADQIQLFQSRGWSSTQPRNKLYGYTFSIMEPEHLYIYEWLFQLDDSRSLLRKWLFSPYIH